MKKINTGQEILLLTNSSLVKKELSGNDFSINNTGKSYRADNLEEACWNGMLNVWLPKTVVKSDKRNPMFLWKIDVGNTFLCLGMSASPMKMDLYYSVDPYLFLPSVNIN